MSYFKQIRPKQQAEMPRFINPRTNVKWFVAKNRVGRGYVIMIDDGVDCICPTMVPYRTFADAVKALVAVAKMIEDSGSKIIWEVLP